MPFDEPYIVKAIALAVRVRRTVNATKTVIDGAGRVDVYDSERKYMSSMNRESSDFSLRERLVSRTRTKTVPLVPAGRAND